MSSTVNIPFRTYLEVGQNKFKVKVPRRFLNEERNEKSFGFSYLSLIPEYYSQQAFYNKLDAPGQNDWDSEYPISLDFDFDLSYMGSKKAFVSLVDEIETGRLIKNINSHFDSKKPEGSLYPPVVIDWYNVNYQTANVSIREFHVAAAAAYYDTTFNESMHDNFLPQSMRQFTNFNNLAFPTTKDEATLADIRIRIHLANNVQLGFSNEKLLAHLGFTPEQIPGKSLRNQIILSNPYENRYATYKSASGPQYKMTDARSSKVTAYANKKHLETEKETIRTTRVKEETPKELLQQINPILSELAHAYNQTLKLEFDEATKTFKLVGPTAEGIRTSVRLPHKLAKLLGYGVVPVITTAMVPEAVQKVISIEESERLSRTLVYDVGMVAVNLEQQFSLQTSQFTNTLMATLEPDYAGTMSTRPVGEMPTVCVTYYSPELEFLVYRFSEKNVPIPLGLQVGAYIQGVLVGKSINTDCF